MEIGFEQLLAQHNQEFKDAEVFNNWMPPDGEYIVSLTKLAHDTLSKDGKDLIWWRLTGVIEDVADAELHGKEFSVGYYTSKAYGILKGAVKTLAGKVIQDLAEAHIVLESSLGKIVRVKVETRPGKGTNEGKNFTNCYIQEVMKTTEAVSAEDVSTEVAAVEAVEPDSDPTDSIPDAPPLETAPETEVVG